MNNRSPIGIFDSGVGGISVLKEVLRQLPNEDIIYFGDTLNAPYGTKDTDQICTLSDQVVQQLLQKDVKAVVIACNTATAAAAQALREKYRIPIIGMEPALKLARDTIVQGKIAVMATPSTLQSRKYSLLNEKYGQQAVSLPCPGLMEFVERVELDSEALHNYLDHLFTKELVDGLKSVVLGCTHYSFLRKAVLRHVPEGTLVVDGNEGTVRQLKRRLLEENMLSDASPQGTVTLLSSSDAKSVKIMASLLKESLD